MLHVCRRAITPSTHRPASLTVRRNSTRTTQEWVRPTSVYQVLGSGPPLVLVADWFGNLDSVWERPPYVDALRRLASFSQLILFDKRGVGLSDPLPTLVLPGLEQWLDDVNGVMDAIGVPSATLMGVGSGGPLCLHVAAAYPGRVERLVLVNSYARLSGADDYRPGYPLQLRDRIL